MDWIGLAGPTASGKTAAALAVAARRPVEIVSVDSALVYRGMDIGTAKPSAAERAAVPHHLVDIRDPREPYSAAEFVADATRLIAEIRSRGALPLLVGGTMLYFKALVDGLDDMPRADAATRAALEAEATTRGWPALHAELARHDPVTAARLAPHDSQRIQRALEVWRLTGRPLSSFHSRRHEPTGDQAGDPGSDQASGPPSPQGRIVSLEPQDRGWLHARIAERFDAMLAAGLVDEVRRLRARRPARGPAVHALRGLPPDLAGAGWAGRPARSRCAAALSRAGPAARAGHRRHTPARQAPDHLAAQHAHARGRGLRRAGRARAGAAAHRMSAARPALP